MRKNRLIKLIFAAAVIVTVIYSVFAVDEIFRFLTLEIPVSSLVTALIPDVVCPVIMWQVYYSLTHDSLGNKIKPSAEPVCKKDLPNQTGRFVFPEDTVCEKIGKIAERFKLDMKYNLFRDIFEIPDYSISLTKKFEKNSFKINISEDCISICSHLLDSYVHNYYEFSYNFVFLDDAFSERKGHKYTYEDHDFEYMKFTSNMMFGDKSDDEIFDIVEKIIDALYGATSMTYETAETEEGKENFTFYLDAPDYYGYTETTEIGNFKFILNGGKQNV